MNSFHKIRLGVKYQKEKVLLSDILAIFQILGIVFIGILSGQKAGLLLFSISIFSLVCLDFIGHLKPLPVIIKSYLVICIMAVFSSFYALEINFSLDVLWKILSVFALMYFFFSYLSSFKSIIKTIYYYLFSTFVLAIYNIVFYEPSVLREIPYGGVNPVALVMFISLVFVILLVQINQKRAILFIPVYVYVLLLTQSQKSILSVLIVIALFILLNMFFLKAKYAVKIIFIGLILVSIGYFFLMKFDYLESASIRTIGTIKAIFMSEAVEGAAGGLFGEGLRGELRSSGWMYFFKSPFWGYGVNNFRVLFGRETGLYTYTHFTPLELILGMGIIALPLYYLVYYKLLTFSIKALLFFRQSVFSLIISSIIALIIIGFYMQTYFDASVHFYLITVFGFQRLYALKLVYGIKD